jgi:hypothetical protein
VIVRDATSDAARLADRELLEDQWREVLAALPAAELHDWLDAGDGVVPRGAVARAIELGLGSSRRSERVPMAASSQRMARENPDLELPASSWVEWGTRWRFRVSSLVAARLANREGRAVLVDGNGAAIDLAAPGALIGLEDNEAAVYELPLVGATADDRRWLHPGLRSCGVDPVHPIGWRGHRMEIYWSYIGAAEVGFLSATDHDWPCGPAKKLWGHEDNDPVAVAVTPRGDLCAQTFEHDVLITVGMPIGWHRAGGVDAAVFARDPRRAVFYAQTAAFVEDRGVANLLEEDNRELAPVVVLGPDETTRYAVDLRHRVVRVTYAEDAAAATVVGGPDAGYAVFDAEHRLVRCGAGLLLGGWFRHATIEHDGALWREDLATGARTLLGAAVRAACLDPDVEMVVQDAIREGRHDAAALLRASHPTRAIEGELCVVAIPGTRNVIEIGERYLRVL